MKDYCLYESKSCETCHLSNYGLDCNNEPLTITKKQLQILQDVFKGEEDLLNSVLEDYGYV